MITNVDQLDLSKSYTYQDYLTWQFEEMVELIRGKVFKMPPSQNRSHQRILGNLHLEVGVYLRNKKCEANLAHFDVRLPLPAHRKTEDKIDTVVQPDLSVICDHSKLDDQGCLGAPDWVIEILSKSTSKKDLKDKFDIYEHAGVREYWIVYPDLLAITPYILDSQGKFRLVRERPFLQEEEIPVGIFPDFRISLDNVFS